MIRALLAATLAAGLVVSVPTASLASSDPECYEHAATLITTAYDADGLVVCEDLESGWRIARNDGDTIWALTTRESFAVAEHTQKSELFHASASSWYPYAFLARGDEVIISPEAADVQFSVQPDLALAWIMFDQLVDKMEAQAEASIGDVIAGNSTRRAALWKCSVAMYKAARKLEDSAAWETDAKQLWKSAQDTIEDERKCATAWHDARNVKAEVPFPPYRAVVLEVTHDAKLTASAITRLTVTQKTLVNLGPKLLCSLPKIRGIGC